MISDVEIEPAKVCNCFIAQMVFLSMPGSIKEGSVLDNMHCHLARFSCKVGRILQKMDRVTGKV